MIASKKAQPGGRKEWLRRFNRKVTNPIMMAFAGRRLYTVVEHVGRRSKRTYHTPVLGQPTEDGFFIPLPYGEDTDWCMNVLAAGGCTVRWSERVYPLTSPHIVGQAEGEAVFPPVTRCRLHSAKVKKYLSARR